MANEEPTMKDVINSASRANSNFLIDKSFWVTLIGVGIVFLNKKFGLNLDWSELAATLGTLAVYIIGNKWKSGQITVAEVHANANAEYERLKAAYLADNNKLLMALSSQSEKIKEYEEALAKQEGDK